MRICYKSYLLATVILFSAFGQKLSAQSLDDPGAYIGAINSAQSQMNKTYMAYMSAAAHSGRARKIEKMRQQTIQSITDCKYKIIDLPIYKGDNSLRKNSIAYVDICYKVFNDDYAHIVNIEEIAEQSFDEMQAYLLLQEKTNEKLHQAFTDMQKAVKLIDTKSEFDEKMEIASKLNHYHNLVYLVFFKCNWQENQITEAINRKNLSNVEQSRNALLTYVKEGSAALDTLRNFEGDVSLAIACKQALSFYKKEAENDLPKISDFFLKEENFNKIKKSIESKAEKTKEDVEAYNKAVKDFNEAVNVYNRVNNNLNTGRSEIIQSWNNAEKAFYDAHMPYYKS